MDKYLLTTNITKGKQRNNLMDKIHFFRTFFSSKKSLDSKTAPETNSVYSIIPRNYQ